MNDVSPYLRNRCRSLAEVEATRENREARTAAAKLAEAERCMHAAMVEECRAYADMDRVWALKREAWKLEEEAEGIAR